MGAWGSAIVWAGLVILCVVVLVQNCDRHGPREQNAPAPLLPPDAKRGEELCKHKGMCLGCHMVNGLGGQNAPDLSHVGKKYIDLLGGKQKAGEFFRVHLTDPVQHPGNENNKPWISKMPSYGDLFSPQEMEDVIEYLLSLPSLLPLDAKRGEDAVQKGMCLSCHMIDDRGGQNAPDLSHVGKKYGDVLGGRELAKEFFRHHLTDPQQFPGNENGKHWPSKMPPYKGIFSDQEMEDLIEYILTRQ